MPDNPPQTGGQPAQGQTPDQQLAALRQDLDKNQGQIDGLTKARDELTAQAGMLSQVVDDSKNVLTSYTSAFPAIAADIDALDGFTQTKTGVAQAKLSDDRRKKVDKVVSDYDTNVVAAKKQASDKLAADAATVRADSDKARNDHQAAQAAYNALKGLQKGVADRDSAAQQVMSEIGSYESKKNYEAMYFRLKDALAPAVADLHGNVVPIDTFKANLSQAAGKVHDTWKAARDKKAAADAADAAAATAKADYDSAVGGRKAEILKQIAALPAPPAPAAPAVPPVPSAPVSAQAHPA